MGVQYRVQVLGIVQKPDKCKQHIIVNRFQKISPNVIFEIDNNNRNPHLYICLH